MNISTSVVEVSASVKAPQRIAVGTGTVYYKSDPSVSSTNKDGTLTAGQTLDITSQKWLVSNAASAQVGIVDLPPVTAVTLYPENFGAVGDGVVDDTAAIKRMIAAADPAVGGEFVFQPGKTYLVNGAPDTSQFGNAIIPIPCAALGSDATYPFGEQAPTWRFRSRWGSCVIKTTRTDTYAYTTATGDTHTTTTVDNISSTAAINVGSGVTGTGIALGTTVTAKTANSITLSAAATSTNAGITLTFSYGSPCVFGGPSPNIAPGNNLSPIGQVEFDGIQIQVPNNPSISGFDMFYVGRGEFRNTAVYTPQTGTGAGQAANPSGVTQNTNKHQFGYRSPSSFNYNHHTLTGTDAQGCYVGYVLSQPHHTLIDVAANFCVVAFGLQVTLTGHGSKAHYIVTTNCKYGFAGWDEITGVKSLAASDHFYMTGGRWTIEMNNSPWDWTAHVLDANNAINLKMDVQAWPIGSALTVTGGAQVVLTKETRWPRVLFDHFSDVVVNNTSAETDLYSDTIPGGLLVNNGDKITGFHAGSIAAHASNTRTFRLKFAGTAFFTSAAFTTATFPQYWTIRFELIRVSASVVRVNATMLVSAGTIAGGLYTNNATQLTGLDLTVGNILKSTAQDSASEANAITASHGAVRYEPAV